MLESKTGLLAGQIWEALQGGALTGKDLKKAVKAKSEKELYLGIGWLLREGKIEAEEAEKDLLFSLK